MNERNRTSRGLQVRHPWRLAAVVALLVVVGAAVYVYTKPSSKVTPIAVAGHTPLPSPGTAGNPGDAAKSNLDTVAPTPSATASVAPGSGGAVIAISDVAVTPQAAGDVHVSDELTGASSGTCQLVLTSPSGVVVNASGQILWSGTYDFCSFGTVSGASQNGAWTAKLTATGSGGQTSNTATAAFTVGG